LFSNGEMFPQAYLLWPAELFYPALEASHISRSLAD
jgi:hypothetical protein